MYNENRRSRRRRNPMIKVGDILTPNRNHPSYFYQKEACKYYKIKVLKIYMYTFADDSKIEVCDAVVVANRRPSPFLSLGNNMIARGLYELQQWFDVVDNNEEEIL